MTYNSPLGVGSVGYVWYVGVVRWCGVERLSSRVHARARRACVRAHGRAVCVRALVCEPAPNPNPKPNPSPNGPGSRSGHRDPYACRGSARCMDVLGGGQR